LKELRVTTGHCVWLVMEGVVPSQITPLQNCPRQYHPQHLKKKKYYFYYYQIDGGDFAIGRSNLHSNV
jgi:hypothetical protein